MKLGHLFIISIPVLRYIEKGLEWISGFLAPLVNKGKKGESYDTWMNELLNCLAPPFICSYYAKHINQKHMLISKAKKSKACVIFVV